MADISKTFNEVVEAIRETAGEPLTDQEAEEAARNLIGLCRTLLAIYNDVSHNQKHGKCN